MKKIICALYGIITFVTFSNSFLHGTRTNTRIEKVMGHNNSTEYTIEFSLAPSPLSSDTILKTAQYPNGEIHPPIGPVAAGVDSSTKEYFVDSMPFDDMQNDSNPNAHNLREYILTLVTKDGNNKIELGRFIVGSACKKPFFGRIPVSEYKNPTSIKEFDGINCPTTTDHGNVWDNQEKYWTGWGSYWYPTTEQSITLPDGTTLYYSLSVELRPTPGDADNGFSQAGLYFYHLPNIGKPCEDPGTGAKGIGGENGKCILTEGGPCFRSKDAQGNLKIIKNGICWGEGGSCYLANGKNGIIKNNTCLEEVIDKSCTDVTTKASGMLDASNVCIPTEGASCTMTDGKTMGTIKNKTCIAETPPVITETHPIKTESLKTSTAQTRGRGRSSSTRNTQGKKRGR